MHHAHVLRPSCVSRADSKISKKERMSTFQPADVVVGNNPSEVDYKNKLEEYYAQCII